MQVEVGNIVDGKVTGITNFGAFVEIESGKTGMVHISEVSNSYVKEINEFLTQNQEVKVKILSIAGDGKISLSIKQCQEKTEAPQEQRPQRTERPQRPAYQNRQSSQDIVWRPKQEKTDDLSFEDMMNKFKQNSNDRMSDLKRANEPKRSRRNAVR